MCVHTPVCVCVCVCVCFASQTLTELGKKARDGTISIDDMAGGTFTISNGGVYGSLLSTPIINPPQVRMVIQATLVSPALHLSSTVYCGIIRDTVRCHVYS